MDAEGGEGGEEGCGHREIFEKLREETGGWLADQPLRSERDGYIDPTPAGCV